MFYSYIAFDNMYIEVWTKETNVTSLSWYIKFQKNFAPVMTFCSQDNSN